MAGAADFRFKDRYKTIGVGKSDAARNKRAQERYISRRNSRVEEFSRRRNLTDCVEPLNAISEQPPADPQKLKLQKWKQMKKEEHERQKKAAKPAFKVGIVRHHPASPYLRDISNIGPANFKFQFKAAEPKQTILTKPTPSVSAVPRSLKKPEDNPYRRVTRAQTRNAQAKQPVTPARPRPQDVKPGASRSLFNIGTPFVTSKIAVQTPARPEFRNVVRSTPARPEFQNLVKSTPVRPELKNVKSTPARPELRRNVMKPTSPKQELQLSKRNIKTVTSELQRNVVDTENAQPETSKSEVISTSTVNEAVVHAPVADDSQGELNSANTDIISTSPVDEAEVHTPLAKRRDETYLPIHYSPFVTTSRGRFSTRSQLSSPPPKQTTPEQTQEHGIVYFRSVLESEIERLTNLCKDWQNIQESVSDIPSEVSDSIFTAIGQTQLLMKKKFCQFRELIERCERHDENEKPVTCTDLDGFWEMMYLQIENVDLRFSKLGEMKQNNWVEKEVVVERKRPVRKTRKAQKPTQSSVRAFISAARQKKPTVLSDNNTQGTPVKKMTPRLNDSLAKMNTSHSRVSLLQEHRRQSRGLVHRDSSPMIIMKVTQMAKMLDGSFLSSQTSDNSVQSVPMTPKEMKEARKSILKSARHSRIPAEQSQNINESDMMDLDVDVSSRRTSRRSTARKVRFEGAGDSSPKRVHPMTPYVSQEEKRKRRLPDNGAENDPTVIQFPSGDLISFDSPVAEPKRVRRRSSRLSNQTRLSYV